MKNHFRAKYLVLEIHRKIIEKELVVKGWNLTFQITIFESAKSQFHISHFKLEVKVLDF